MSDSGHEQQPDAIAQSAAPPDRGRIGVVGLVLAAVSALLLILACTALNWFTKGKVTGGRDLDTAFSNVRHVLSIADQSGQAQAALAAKIYFHWGAWTLAAIAVLAAVLASLDVGGARLFGAAAVVFGLIGVAATFAAVDLISAKGSIKVPTYGDYLSNVGPAFFCAVAGFLVAAFGGVAGARSASR